MSVGIDSTFVDVYCFMGLSWVLKKYMDEKNNGIIKFIGVIGIVFLRGVFIHCGFL